MFQSMTGLLETDLYNDDSREEYSALYRKRSDGDEWKIMGYRSVLKKYNDLKKKYTERFIEEITRKPEEKEEREEREEVKIEDLDFDGSTE